MGKRWVLRFAFLLAVSFILFAVYIWYEVEHLGPYVRHFNLRNKALVENNGLMGKEPSDVEKVLGKPAFIRKSEGYVVYNYLPFSFFPFAKFQAIFRTNTLVAVKLFDD